MTMNQKLTTDDVKAILAALKPWINQKPDLERADYGCDQKQAEYTGTKQYCEGVRAYRQDLRNIQKQGTRARRALKLALTYEPNPQAMASALTRYSGRLSWTGKELEYCTGQYFPTEYRVAAGVVLEDYCETCRPKYNPPDGFDPQDVDDIKRASHAKGSHFFDRDSMRFFRSRVLSTIYKGQGGIFFVTSEQYADYHRTGPRLFTVRQFHPADADISTVGDFNKLTRAQAIRLAKDSADAPPKASAA